MTRRLRRRSQQYRPSWPPIPLAAPLATAVARVTGAQQDRSGRLVVEADLTLPGHPSVYVTGDVMSLDELPGVAEVAMQSGLHAASEIHRVVEHGDVEGRPFRYRNLGSAAYISRGRPWSRPAGCDCPGCSDGSCGG